jgi:hypothetical protein
MTDSQRKKVLAWVGELDRKSKEEAASGKCRDLFFDNFRLYLLLSDQRHPRETASTLGAGSVWSCDNERLGFLERINRRFFGVLPAALKDLTR